MSWEDVLKRKNPREITSEDLEDRKEAMKMSDLTNNILREIEKEGGALGMKNLKQFADEDTLRRVLSFMENEGQIFMHKDGETNTHEPK